MSDTISVAFDHALPDAPDWVQLVPAGKVTARDGRRFVNDKPEAVLATFRAGGIELPVDYEHQNEKPEAKLSGPVPAAGSIKELAVRADGIWGRVDWTDRARALIRAREYRFLSPSMMVEKDTGRLVKIKGAGLVHNPALHITALASEENRMDPTEFMAQLADLLDIEGDADETAILSAFKSRLEATKDAKPNPRDYVPMKAYQEAMAKTRTTVQAASENSARAKVDAALRDGHITPAAKSWALELCIADEASFDEFLAASPAPFRHLTDRTRFAHARGVPSDKDQAKADDPAVALLCEQLGLSPERFA
ncbi:phage protease [Thalassococcus sp. CAU 1522]|uniref:Phage protease n=1 Tax=Thalassococcus arenae TaxID=2851652 RepID=A0ABS6NAJ4_9RHOB|nr:phage protease [Thalassococcus arenae]MBV2360993.1 phage protease [Thalassococcus arenae]